MTSCTGHGVIAGQLLLEEKHLAEHYLCGVVGFSAGAIDLG
ncbi:MAG: hypothetical protein QF489_04820 [Planctomycetota bacterium]|nr:hypothetical protein [Planctomycetota bacterium]